jgi:hypothetical protein
MSQFLRAAFVTLLVLLLPACALRDKTTLDASWAAAGRGGASLGKVAIITVADSEFVQADVQQRLAKGLRERGVNAVATGRYFTRYTDEERERFRASVQASGADTILLARVTSRETRVREVPDTIMGPANVPANTSLDVYGAFVVYGGLGRPMPQADFAPTTITSEASLYEGAERKLSWSAKIRTRNAGTGDRAAALDEYVGVVLGAMEKDGVIRRP